ncbi:MAG: J domain-containing protein [Pyrinomonadaceae bacterium]|nr:J domain-containing protein [Pyrinomonadaceae bacterium]
MSEFDSRKDYYGILGADERTSGRELERLYKRMAARHHPDKGGSEEEMKTLNEAYRVLRNEETKRDYDAARFVRPAVARAGFNPRATQTAQDVGLFGHGLSALLCLLVGVFLLLLVRFQWMFFLWPLLILAGLVILFGIFMARSALRTMNASLPASNRFRGYTRLQEALFWIAVLVSGYGLYLLLTAI